MNIEHLYDTRAAAAYLCLSVATIKYHLYVSRQLVADKKVGSNLIFKKETLDRFNAQRTRPGQRRKPV